MTAAQFKRWCEHRNACFGGLQCIDGKTAAQFWETCTRGDYMLWLAWKAYPLCPTVAKMEQAFPGLKVRHLLTDGGIHFLTITERREYIKCCCEAAKAYREAFGNPFLKENPVTTLL